MTFVLPKSKFRVEMVITTHCTGCGLSFKVRADEPGVIFDDEMQAGKLCKRMVQLLTEHECPNCKNRKPSVGAILPENDE